MIITKTPLRISLLGGNTDFPKYFEKYGGAVLTTTIDKYVYCIVKERFDDQIWINYSIKEVVKNVNKIKHGLVREAMKLTGVTKGVEITFLSDIPSEGSGLGSSSAILIGLLNALHHFQGVTITAEQLAQEACKIEVEILKKPIGYQDQVAIAFGGTNFIEFKKDGIKIKKVKLDTSEDLLLFYTGITRQSSKVLTNLELNKKILDQTKSLAMQGIYGDSSLGELLDQHWWLKKQLNPKVTNSLIDHMYARALYAGAVGGKIVGAGGGGFLLVATPPERADLVRKHLYKFRELPFKISNYGSKVIFDINE